MRTLLLSLLFSIPLLAESFYTLDNVHSLNLYLANETEFIDKAQKEKMDKVLTKKLEEAGFVFGKTDAYIFVVKIKSLEIEESVAISIQVGLGEEVTTKRKDKIETFAYTYLENKLIEGYDPYEDTMEALNGMIEQFIDAHKDDNEQMKKCMQIS